MSAKSFFSLRHVGPAAWFPVFAVLAMTLLASGCASNKKAVQTAAPAAAFWPPYPDEPRLQFVASYSVSTDVQPKRSSFDEMIYGKESQQVLPLTKPYGVEMWNGKIYVCDLRNNSVTVLDLKGKRVLVLGKTATDALQTPTDIAVAPEGTKYVADAGRGIIAVYGPDDRRINSFGRKDFKPVALAVHGEELFVCDFQASQVQVLNRRTGQFVRTIGSPGGEPGQFVRPLGICVDGQGCVYVMDVMKCQLQKFDPAGKFVSNFGTITAKAGGLVRPKQIDVDRDGTIYAVDAAFQNVQLFDQKGQVLTFFGSPGTHPGAMYLPAGVCVHEGDLELFKDKIHPAFQAERLVLVTNQFGPNKVSVYAMGHLRPGKTVQDIASSRGLIPAGVDDGKGKGGPPVVAPSAEPPAAEPPSAEPPTAPGQDQGEGKVVGAGAIGGGSAAAAPAAADGRAAGPLTAADPPALKRSAGLAASQ